jgi:hypothetical protein
VNVIRFSIALIFASLVACAPAQADKRVALVIGNSAYKNAPRLANPVNDAGLVGGMFRNAGFDTVEIKLDLNASEMRRSLRDFAARTRDADMAVFTMRATASSWTAATISFRPMPCWKPTATCSMRRSRSTARCTRSNRPNNFASSSSMRAATTHSPRR